MMLLFCLSFLILHSTSNGSTGDEENDQLFFESATDFHQPQLKLSYRERGHEEEKIHDLIVTCELLSDEKFEPEIRMILCSDALTCENQKHCFNNETNTNTFCTEQVPDVTRYLKEFPHWLDSGMLECRDKFKPDISSMEFILRIFHIPGMHNILSRDVKGSDLIQLKYLNGSTGTEMYQNGTRCFYRDSQVEVVAFANKFFFPNPQNALGGLCNWTLVFRNGSRKQLYGYQVPWQQDVVKFSAQFDSVAVACSIKWYNSSTDKLEEMFPYKIIDRLVVMGAPEIDRTLDGKLTLSSQITHKISCKFSGGDGNVTWTSQERAFNSREPVTMEAYRNLLEDDIIESVVEVTYFLNDDTNWNPDVDNVTCTVENEFGIDSFTFIIQVGTGLSVIQSSLVILMGFVFTLSALWAFVVVCKKWRNSAGTESEL